jgi:hypothetical protein
LGQFRSRRSGVNLVTVDVSVLDRDRGPVRGLTAADFTILENGQGAAVVAVRRYRRTRAENGCAAAGHCRGVPAGGAPGGRRRGRRGHPRQPTTAHGGLLLEPQSDTRRQQ